MRRILDPRWRLDKPGLWELIVSITSAIEHPVADWAGRRESLFHAVT